MQYSVIVEQKNGVWRAVIPSLPDLRVEGASLDDALRNAQRAAQDYLSNVVVTAIDVETPVQFTHRAGGEAMLSASQNGTDLLNYSAAEQWASDLNLSPQNPDDPIYQQFLAALAAEKKRQREE